MSVISITIAQSAVQKVAGIPLTVTLTTNIPATIFYTLDGSNPTIASSVVTGPIALPTNNPSVTLKAFATDGPNTSPTITKLFAQDITGARQAHDEVTGLNQSANKATFPFGDRFSSAAPIFGNVSRTNIVDSPSIAGIPDGYDGTGTGSIANETDNAIDSLSLVFSETNSIGARGRGIGTLPATVTVVVPTPSHPSTSSDANSPFFNPKSLVIYQDGTQEAYDPEMPQMNRPFIHLEDPERVRDGALQFNTAFEGSVPTGGLVRQHFNPRDQTITYYYFDSTVLRWIISKEPFTPKDPQIGQLSNMVFSSRSSGDRFVYKWIPFKRRVLA